MDMLDRLYIEFDSLADKHKLFKVRNAASLVDFHAVCLAWLLS